MNAPDTEEGTHQQGRGAPEPGLIFVTGASRSGTTLLARLLGGHSAVLTLNELHYFGELWHPAARTPALAGADLVRLAAEILRRHERGLWSTPPEAAELARATALVERLAPSRCNAPGLFAAVLAALGRAAGRRLVCEQTPRNIFYAGRLLELYPVARIVHIVRDPRAVLASQKNRWRLRELGAAHLPRAEMLRNRVNYHPLTISRLWRAATREALRYADHPRFLLVRFEELAADPQAGSARLCGFLGLDPEPGMLDLPRWGSSHLPHSGEGGIARELVDRWRELLAPGERMLCERMTAPLMARLGYETTPPGRSGLLAMAPCLLSYPLHLAAVAALNPGRALIQLRALAACRSR